MLRGQFISGPQLVELAEIYTEALNKGSIPVIESAWEYVQSGEMESAFKQSLEMHEKWLGERIGVPLHQNKAREQLAEIKKETIELFKSTTVGEITNTKNQNFLNKLKAEIKSRKVKLLKHNAEQTKKCSQQLIEQLVQASVKTKANQGLYASVGDL
jgi:hypothetical protein